MEERRISRRAIILAPFAYGLSVACSEDRNRQVPTEIRKLGSGSQFKEGVWSQKTVENLARSMMGEVWHPDIAYAGYILLENQEGRKSLSQMSTLFSDNKIEIISQKILDSHNPSLSVPIEAIITEAGPRVYLNLLPKPEVNSPRIFADYPSKLKIESINLNLEDFADNSEFILKFYITKEIYNTKAAELVSRYVSDQGSSYQEPSDEGEKRAYLLFNLKDLVFSGYSSMPANFMADIWAYFLTLPEYNRARDRNKFSVVDIGELKVYESLSSYFLRKGILIKTASDDYRWTNNADELYKSWVDRAARFHAALSGVKLPSEDNE